MTALEIQSKFPEPYLARWVLADATYALPTMRWLQGPFWDSFQADRWAKGLKTWARKNDCDSFARAYAQHAQDAHAITTGSNDEGLAVGEIFYTRHDRQNHAIVCAFTEKGRVFIEPQNGQELAMTPAELGSIFFVRF